MPTIKNMAYKYKYAFDSFDDAMSEISIRMIRVIDRGVSEPKKDISAWYSFLCKKNASYMAWERCRKNTVDVMDVEDDSGYYVDPTDSIAITDALSRMRKGSSDAFIKVHILGMSAEEAGVDKDFLSRAKKQFISAWDGVTHTDSPNRSDKCIYKFKHKSGESFSGTRVDFCNYSGVTKNGVHKIVSGIQKTHKGWSVEE